VKRGERKKQKKKHKRPHIHTETLMTTPPVPLKKSWRDKSNDTKKNHKWWMKESTRALQICLGSLVFGSLVWPPSFIVCYFPWYCWIHLVDIFPIILIMSSLKFWCVFEVFFSFHPLSSLFIKCHVFQILQFERVANDTCNL